MKAAQWDTFNAEDTRGSKVTSEMILFCGTVESFNEDTAETKGKNTGIPTDTLSTKLPQEDADDVRAVLIHIEQGDPVLIVVIGLKVIEFKHFEFWIQHTKQNKGTNWRLDHG